MRLEKSIETRQLISNVDPSPEVRALREKIKDQNHKIVSLKIGMGNDQEFFGELLQEVKAIEPRPIQYTPGKLTRVESPVSCVLLLSDWHIGCVIDGDEIEGFNDFSHKIAQRRVTSLVEKVLAWVTLHRAVYKVDEISIILVGDLISGDIHDELKVTNEFPVPVQIVNAAVLVSEAIAACAPHFKSVKVEFLVPDNHSRLTKKPQFKQSGLNSYNYLVGWIAQQRVSKLRNVHFNLMTSIKQVVHVQKMRYLLLHGNGIKGWSGFPYYGIDRQASREAIARMKKPVGTHFDKIVLGHFHAPLWHPKWVIGGSLSGTDELDHSCGREAEPCQVAWFVHAKHGEFNHTEFRLA